MKKLVFCLIFLCAAFNLTFAQAKKKPVVKTISGSSDTASAVSSVSTTNLTPELKRRVETFQLVWKTIKDNYFDQTFSGLDWEKIRKEYEPLVLKTVSDTQLHTLLQSMINRLNRSHFQIIPPEFQKEIEKAKSSHEKYDEKLKAENEEEMSGDEEWEDESADDSKSYSYGIGVDLRLIDNQFVVTNVEKNSAGEKAGIKLGFVIEKINDVSLSDLLEKLQTYNNGNQKFKKMLPLQIVSWFLNGEEDSSVSISYLDEKEQLKQIQVRREKLNGLMLSISEDFPAQFFKFETKSLSDEVGYVKFNLFALSAIGKFCDSLTEFKDKKAIIIDLRGNVGGLIGVLMGISGMLTEKPMELGTQIYKIGSDKMFASPKAKNYKGKLVFLTDSVSISSAEVFAAAMQENNRALIVGEKSAGEALPSLSIVLPTGAALVYPIANFKTPNGNYLEGKGVTPNFIATLDRKSLLEGKDNQIDTALRIIKEDTAFPKQIDKPIEIVVAAGNTNAPIILKPTPKPITNPPLKILGNVSVKAPKLKEEKEEKEEIDVKDEKSLQIISDFYGKIGGEDSLRKIESYELKGYTKLQVKGTVLNAEISIYRQKPSKYALVMKSESVGEFREIYTDKNFLFQTDFGNITEFPISPDTATIEIFAPIFSLLDRENFKSLKYLGEFDREGRKAQLVEAKTKNSVTVTLAFDSETKLLVGYASASTTLYLGEYRKVENVLLPFEITKDGAMKIFVTETKLNQKIDETVFIKKENCFDRPS
jgi:carboxyl-terminal processing protease